MTPLARKIVIELTLPRKRRTFGDQCGLLKIMDDVHCFECSDVFDAATSLAQKQLTDAERHGRLALAETQMFLPAPKTWIEFKFRDGHREGVLLVDRGNGVADAFWAIHSSSTFASAVNIGALQLSGAYIDIDAPVRSVRTIPGEDEALRKGWIYQIYAFLAMINTPRIIGRQQHMPNRTLERRLVSQKSMVGRFPLHAWTEIKLRVCAPKNVSGEASAEAHLTGERALHFCRAHLRIRLGRLEVVRAHWRGDPSLGIKQSRYKLQIGA